MKSVSIVVPAYNEEKRILPFLEELTKFCKKNLKNYEIIVVDDGSTDDTAGVVKPYLNKNVKLISYKQNMGKGYAVREGFFAAKGKYLIFIDADGSTKPNELLGMIKSLRKNNIVIGVRNTKESNIVVKQPFYRVLLGKTFNNLVKLFLGVETTDMLCGFKGFNSEIARELFDDLLFPRWAFDVEVMYKAKKKNYKLNLLPITWENVAGSKMNSIFDPPKLFIDVWKIKWKVDRKSFK